MRLIAGGIFSMGSERFYPEESPVRRVRVDDFWIDETPVTNSQFRRFVEETGYVTFAEKAPDPRQYPGLDPAMAKAGSAVFVAPTGKVDLTGAPSWWTFCFGASWRHPLGPESSIDGLENHPVVHVAYEDAEAYAHWIGKSLPTEAEFEYAARGGSSTEYAWGEELAPGGAMLANYWQGRFPFENLELDGWARTSPVRSFPQNGYGLYDMIGNVWEWTRDWYAQHKTETKAAGGCCAIENPRGAKQKESYDQFDSLRIPRKVLKGGSHLCAENYCRRYRPAARFPQPIDTTTGHVGFRCVLRESAK